MGFSYDSQIPVGFSQGAQADPVPNLGPWHRRPRQAPRFPSYTIMIGFPYYAHRIFRFPSDSHRVLRLATCQIPI